MGNCEFKKFCFSFIKNDLEIMVYGGIADKNDMGLLSCRLDISKDDVILKLAKNNYSEILSITKYDKNEFEDLKHNKLIRIFKIKDCNNDVSEVDFTVNDLFSHLNMENDIKCDISLFSDVYWYLSEDENCINVV